MIITTLATHAYQGQPELAAALRDVVTRMPLFIKASKPRIENPVNKKEDFADKWASDPNYELNFHLWHQQLAQDLDEILLIATGHRLQESISERFQINLDDRSVGIDSLARTQRSSLAIPAAAPLLIPSATKPWGT